VLLSDHLTLLVPLHGAVTLVPAWRATDKERERALHSLAARSIVGHLRQEARHGDRQRLIEAFELASPSGGVSGYRSASDDFLERTVLDAFRGGRLLAVPGWYGMSNYPATERRETLTSSAPPALSEPEAMRVPASTPKKERATWFEVEVVDEVGDPVAGAALVFDVDGELRQLATNGSGVARLDGARERSASVRISDLKALRSKFGAKWTAGRDREWIAPLPLAVEVCEGVTLHPIQLDAEQRARVMLHPPQRVRLLDHDGSALANVSCSVSVGGVDLALTTDGAGWIEFPVGVDSCPETARVGWSETRDGITRKWSVDVVLECHAGEPDAVARARLQSLGYEVDDLAHAVAEFQRDYELPDEDASGGAVPPATREKLAEIWEEAHA